MGGDTVSSTAASAASDALKKTSNYNGGKRTSFAPLPSDKKDAAADVPVHNKQLRPSLLTYNNNININNKSSGGDGDGGLRRNYSAPLFRGPHPQDDDDRDKRSYPQHSLRSQSMLAMSSCSSASDRPPMPLSSRPVISRKASVKASMISIDTLSEDEGHNDCSNGNISNLSKAIRKLSTLSPTGNAKEIRRGRMSMDNQLFIPPKNRSKGVLAAFRHLMAGRVVDTVLWTYKASFAKVLLLFLTFYIVNIFLWAGVIDGVDLATGSRCIPVLEDIEGEYKLTSMERYEFAFELSWTTFTTVGYGAISPSPDTAGCYPIRLVCAFVAFLGVLYGATSAAIMYSKLMRLLAQAHVTFSSTLCVQYGKGREEAVRFGQFNFKSAVSTRQLTVDDDDDEEEEEEESPQAQRVSNGSSGGPSDEEDFPVIEFRIVNDRANHEGSEIWDAQIGGIIQLQKDTSRSSHSTVGQATGGESTLDLDKKAYYRFELTPDSHPHFSRIWYARHVLNDKSPLLKREIRDMIIQEGGKWDKDFNTSTEIRKCLNEFISLRITLSGTSAVSANTVFAEHVYEYEDVVVGWQFANMVYEKETKRPLRLLQNLFGCGSKGAANTSVTTKVDTALIHDIVPQPGDDYEDLDERNRILEASPES